MNFSSARYRVNSSEVVHEQVDGEVIAIDLGRGSYFSLSGGAADVWAMLERGASRDELTAAFEGAADPADLEREVDELLTRLVAEVLVRSDGTEPAGDPPGAGSVAYRPLVFEKYDDLQDYFALDPIHEVGGAGWPHQKAT